jgi:ketol-acid reductoisomerase
MAVQILKESDGSLAPLQGKTVAILGFGSQGHAHAQNGRDSGINVIVSELEGTDNYKAAVEAGFKPLSADQAVKQADIILITLPDEVQPAVYEKQIAPNLKAGQTLVATHGFNIHFKTIVPPKDVNVVMVAPKGPGHVVRSEFERGGGVPCLIAVHQDATGNAQDIAMAWTIAIGGARAGVIVSNFKDEVETDLFGEQVVLCGGLTELIKAGFETLTEAGYAEEMAYYEVCHELKLIIDLIERGGLNYMRYSVSNTAEFGDYHMGPRIITAETRKEMKKALKEIQDGTFAKTFRDDFEKGFPWFKQAREKDKNHPIEKVGKKLRAMMPWLKAVEM